MKHLLPLLFLSSALAQAPVPPSNVQNVPARLDDLFILVPTVLTNYNQIQAVYTWPHTQGQWTPEYSTNGINWLPITSEWAALPDRATRGILYTNHTVTNMLRMVSTSDDWTATWLVRLRKTQ